MFCTGFNRPILGYDEYNTSVDCVAEPITGSVTHSVVFELLGSVFLIIVSQKAHGRVLAVHIVHDRLDRKSVV